jgi:hypothetical protein
MRVLAIGLFALSAVSFAQQREPGREKPGDVDRTPRRLESVTWNSVKHELTWVVSKGENNGAAYKPLSTESYLINMDDATMSFHSERRRFSSQEAVNVHTLMDLVAKYAVDSTVWWDEGQGERIDGNDSGKPKKDNDKPRPADNLAVVRVSLDRSASLADLQDQIRALESRLAELKRMERLLLPATPVQLTSF